MLPLIKTLHIAMRTTRIEILYYCPRCEAIGEIQTFQNLVDVVCHECREHLDATKAVLEVSTIPEEPEPEGGS